MRWFEAIRFRRFRHLNGVQSKVRAIGPLPPGNIDPEAVSAHERRDGGGKLIRNLLLLSLSNSEFEWLQPSLSFEHFPHHAYLYEPGDELESVHFPNRGLISLLAVTKEGKLIGVLSQRSIVADVGGAQVLLPELEHPERLRCPYCDEEVKDSKELSRHIDNIHIGRGLLQGNMRKWE